MTHPIRNRSRLMLGCGSAALALALAMAPQSARAQGIDATGNAVLGSAEITNLSPTETLVELFDPTVVIDWTPNENAAGDAADFIRTGALARFEGPSLPNFAVLNRILPSTNGNIAMIDGTVISRVFDPNSGGLVRGGFVAFYSPTGMLIGNNATFDVGSLMLTTLNITDANFQNFASNGFMQLQGAQGSTARIQINPGAQISALAENSFFAVVAADVQMLGTARINGSHAYVAGEVVNLSFSNGLFNISVPVGTADTGTVMELGGNIGGLSSNGLGDNHMIYAVARAQADPISMIFRGNLGFDPAQSAGVVNGEIILSANHNVFGRTVDGGNISDGINATFGANSATSNVRADIFMEDFNASSSVLAISTHRTQVTAFNNDSSVLGNLLMVGRENAELTASNGQNFIISGDVLVSAQDYGVVSSSLQSLDAINATGGVAFIDAFGGGNMSIGGSALVAADAFAGADDLNRIAGTAQGGQALIGSTGGTLSIDGNATVTARGIGTGLTGIQTGATVRGGLAQFFSVQGGQVTLGGNLVLASDAFGAQGALFSPSTRSDAFGGQTLLNIFNGAGSINIGGEVRATASAIGGSANIAGAGSVGDAGVALVNVDGAGTITINGPVQLEADGTGGVNAGGIGGTGLGGRASVTTFNGGTINIGAAFDADADGVGGNGQTGGDGFGGIAGANAVTGAITLSGGGLVTAAGLGGNATFGFGGNGGLGRGGNAFFQANGTLTATASLTVIGDALAFAQGVGGDGGQGDGSVTPAGRGGDGYGGQFTVPNQADANFGSGAFILAGGDNGTLSVSGQAHALSSGFGGQGGNGGSVGIGGRGGDGFGGLAQVGLALLGGNGSVAQGSATFASLLAEAEAVGGIGGFSVGDFPTGDGGNALGGNAFLTVRAGTVTADAIDLDAEGFGGEGANGGTGTGGIAAAFGSLGGALTTDFFNARASGFGGFGGADLTNPGNGGNGQGGEAELDFQGITVQINGDAEVVAEGYGGGTGEFIAGNGTGGTARLGVLGNTLGTGTITGNTIVSSNGFGGRAVGAAGQAGNGFGGTSSLQAFGSGAVNLATVQVMANGFGGRAIDIPGIFGGNGTGGNADITAAGSGSRITIASNVPNRQSSEVNFGAILSSNGVGGLATSGTGVGGTGRGGTATVAARLGGSVALPATPFADPDTVGFIRLQARGFGGDTTVIGGSGGTSFGGNAIMEADGGSLSMGETVLSSFTEGGTAQGNAINVTGGNAFAGSRRVSIRNGGTATINFVGGGPGAQGGNGSGTGNGGDAAAGFNLFEVIDSSVNLTGFLNLTNRAQGGTGAIGGDALAGTVLFTATNSAIIFQPGANGEVGLQIDAASLGGLGVTQGGNAEGSNVEISITGSSFLNGALSISANAVGGSANVTNGRGGTALGGTIRIFANPSTISLIGNNIISADAQGGDAAFGGDATGGSITAELNQTQVTITGDNNGVSALRFFSQATAGRGINDANGVSGVGNASGGNLTLQLADSTVTASDIALRTSANAESGNSEVAGGIAAAGNNLVRLAGASEINVTSMFLESLATGSIGSRVVQIGVDQQGNPIFGTIFDFSSETIGGSNRLWLEENGTSRVNAFEIDLNSENTGGGTNLAGRFSIEVLSGEVSTSNLNGRVVTFSTLLAPSTSEVIVRGGALLADNASFNTAGDLAFTTSDGGIIGSDAATGSSNSIVANAGGTISVVSEGTDRGLMGGRSISLNAGRSMLLDGTIASAGGVVSLVANDFFTAFSFQPQPNVFTMTSGARIDAGTGTVAITLVDGAGDPQRETGAITLGNISAGLIQVSNQGSDIGNDINILADGVLTASGTGRAIDLRSLNGEVINLAGDAGLVLTGGGHFGIFAATPTGSQIGSLANFARRYNVLTESAFDQLNPGGNFAAFRISPVLTVTINDATRLYGNANPQFTTSISGFLAGDGMSGVTGTPEFITLANATSNVGAFAINGAIGTLLSEQGYQFSFTPGTVTITPRPITVTANSLSRIYGNANPALTFTVGGQGLVNGDQLTGALATSASVTTGVGNVAITQGTLAASPNYTLTFVGGQLTITPRPLRLIANSFSRLFGVPDPAFTFQISGNGLINGDQLTGALVRDPGENIGNYAIRQGSLTAGPNYAIDFVNGQLTIDPPPAPPVLGSQTIIEEPLTTGDDPPRPGEEEEDRFGIDFPDQPEAPLISEEPLLDDPVTSGGDASLYSGGGVGNPGSKDK